VKWRFRAIVRRTVSAPAQLDAAPLPSEVSPNRVRRAALRVAALGVVVVAVIVLTPGLSGIRNRFTHAQAGWLVLAVVFEILSCLGYVLAFRMVFCTRMTWGTSYKIGMAEQGANSLLPAGGAGGLALGAWALRRGGMPDEDIARKTVAFFLLTSLPNVGALVLLGIGLAAGVLPGHSGFLLSVIPAVVAGLAIGGTLTLRSISRRAASRISQRQGGRWSHRLASGLNALGDGVEDAVGMLRHANPLLIIGSLGYLVFDILVLWASFRALGSSPELAIIWIAYLIGQLGNLIPIPGGIGGVELGLVGALVLYGLPAGVSTAAVLLYRGVQIWVPALLGGIAFIQLRALLRREAEEIEFCQPGQVVEVIGRGQVVAKPSA
jgi:uncharacterized protein (TIRG00374 family)